MSIQQVSPESVSPESERVTQLARLARRLHVGNTIASTILWIISSVVALIFIAIIVKILFDGAPTLVTAAFYGAGPEGVAKELFNTFYILILSEIFLFPIALAAAIYLIEYAPQGRLVTSIHFAAETLAGVPSLVLGMFGFLVFSSYAHMGTMRPPGALT